MPKKKAKNEVYQTVKINVGRFDYNVQIVNDEHSELEDNRGLINYETLNIYINNDSLDERKVHTFYHELSHAICENTGFNDIIMDKLGIDDYECFIDHMGKTLYSVIHNNDLENIEKIVKS